MLYLNRTLRQRALSSKAAMLRPEIVSTIKVRTSPTIQIPRADSDTSADLLVGQTSYSKRSRKTS